MTQVIQEERDKDGLLVSVLVTDGIASATRLYTRPEAVPHEWEPVEWQRRSRKPGDIDDLSVHLMRSPFYEGTKYAVRQHGRCLNKSGEWEYEPMPSSRDDEFYARCRFDSFEDAVKLLPQRHEGSK